MIHLRRYCSFKRLCYEAISCGRSGSVESALVSHIKERIKRNHKGKERIVLEKFADAVEEIPLTIARNAGMNIMDVAIKLRDIKFKGQFYC